ncbi:MAG: hypothetical protein ACRCY4_01590 [Brevinema sp.]
MSYSFEYLMFEGDDLYYMDNDRDVVIVRIQQGEVAGFAMGNSPQDAKKTLTSLKPTD